MKKIILSLVFAMVSIISFGQVWTSTNYEADELTNTEAYTAYTYSSEVGHFIYWSNKPDQFRIISNSAIFNYNSGYSKYAGHYCGFNIMVGLYDKNDNLIDKFTMWLDCPSSDGKPTFGETRNMGKMFNPVGQAKKCKKIFSHLKTTGYVRIVADLYGTGKFDMKINHQ